MNIDNKKRIKKDDTSIKRRITQACILCRKKKIKCDGTKPECLHCQEANLQCEYTEYKKRGPHKGYVRLLEERLVQLERKLTSTGVELPPPIASQSSFSPPTKHETLLQLQSQTKENDDFPPPQIVTHLIDLFFQYVNSVFPLVHRSKLKQAMSDGSVSKPLLWGVMAIAARFSDHPSIKTNPPYLAGEKFARKAISLIDSSLLEPTIPNLQFWGIMSCLEYGRASGTKAYIYGGIAVRICYEMGLHKEETLRTPIYKYDRSIDYVAMAFRRRIFWSCYCIDKFASTSTNHPQGFDIGEYDAETATIKESQCLLDPIQGFTMDHLAITNDPLMDIIPHYLRIIERFGEVCKFINKAKSNSVTVTWPPISEFNELHQSMLNWYSNLPQDFHFTQELLKKHRERSCQNYLNFWLCSHGMYCTGMLALHRGSLAYSDLSAVEVPQDVYSRIQSSIQICKENVDMAAEVFKALRDICGCNVLPYMGYCAYIFSTVLMTSCFSSDPNSYIKSNANLSSLQDFLDVLRPYWQVCDRLAQTTRELVSTHSKLYNVPEQQQPRPFNYEEKRLSDSILPPPQNFTQYSPDIESITSSSTAATAPTIKYPSFGSTISPTQNNTMIQTTSPYQQQAFTQPYLSNDIDFNSCEFLYDSALFGQIIFDTSFNNNNNKYLSNPEAMDYLPASSLLLNQPQPQYRHQSL